MDHLSSTKAVPCETQVAAGIQHLCDSVFQILAPPPTVSNFAANLDVMHLWRAVFRPHASVNAVFCFVCGLLYACIYWYILSLLVYFIWWSLFLLFILWSLFIWSLFYEVYFVMLILMKFDYTKLILRSLSCDVNSYEAWLHEVYFMKFILLSIFSWSSFCKAYFHEVRLWEL